MVMVEHITLYQQLINGDELQRNSSMMNHNSTSMNETAFVATVATVVTTMNNILDPQSSSPTNSISINNNTNSTTTAVKILHQLTYNLDHYYTPLITFTGAIGNVLSILVFFRTKLRKLSSSYYLAALGITDTGFLLINFISWLNFLDIHLYNIDILCQLFSFLSGLCAALSVWFVVAFTVERFIAVLYPLRRQTMCTVRRAKSILYGLVVVSLIHSMPLLVLMAPRHNEQLNATVCDVVNGHEVSALY